MGRVSARGIGSRLRRRVAGFVVERARRESRVWFSSLRGRRFCNGAFTGSGPEGEEVSSRQGKGGFHRAHRGGKLSSFLVALEVGYLNHESFSHIENGCKGISGVLTRLIGARRRAQGSGSNSQ